MFARQTPAQYIERMSHQIAKKRLNIGSLELRLQELDTTKTKVNHQINILEKEIETCEAKIALAEGRINGDKDRR